MYFARFFLSVVRVGTLRLDPLMEEGHPICCEVDNKIFLKALSLLYSLLLWMPSRRDVVFIA